VSTNPTFSIVCGWFLSPNAKSELEFIVDSEHMQQVCSYLPRPDVLESLSIEGDNVTCRGFVAIINTAGVHLEHVSLKVDNVVTLIENADNTTDETELLNSLPEELRNYVSNKAIEVGIIPHSDYSDTEYCIDSCVISSEGIIDFEGWAVGDHISSFELIDNLGQSENIGVFCETFFRQDVIDEKELSDINFDAGFRGIARAQNMVPTHLKITFKSGHVWCEPVQPAKHNLLAPQYIKRVLKNVDVFDSSFFESGYKSALNHIQNLWNGNNLLSNLKFSVNQYGKEIDKPSVSIIIPIYGRYDFIQHQVSQFSIDSDMEKHEIIYVLDDPSIEREFNIACHGVYETFKLPFKTVFAHKNLGFTGANNIGAQHAKGDYILALNSDILPSSTHWVSNLVTQFESLENPGILSTTLVYEDETIQHYGMAFEKDAYYPEVWMNFHPDKGMPLDLIDRPVIKEVEAVTGALMLMETQLFKAMGGFDTCYILGDFEDSDLCLKVIEQGKKIYIDGKEKLYHLERLSQNLVEPGDWKFKLTLLNGLYQKDKWNTLIEKVKIQHA
jgi:GT2 family glycosyltransferase